MIDITERNEQFQKELEARIRTDLLDHVFQALPLSLLAVIIASLVLAWTNQDSTEPANILVWLGFIMVITTGRWILLRYYLTAKQEPSFCIERWEFLASVGTILSGLTWGMASIVFFDEQSIAHQAFLAFIIAGMSAGAITTLSAQLLTALAFVLLSNVPLALQFAMSSHNMAIEMAVMILFFVTMLIPISLRFHYTLKKQLTEHFERDYAEERLSKSESKFESIFQGAPMGIGAVDLEGRILNANQSFCDLLGYTHQEIMTKSFSDFTHPDDQPSSRMKFMQLLEGKTFSYRVENRYIRKDGLTIWARTHIRGIYDTKGNLDYIVGMVEDISDQVRAEREMKQLMGHLQVIYDSTPDMIFLQDEKGRIVYANDKACNFLGYDLGELLIMPIEQFIGSDYSFEQAMEKIRHTLTGEHLEFEWVVRTREGNEFPVEVRLAPLTQADPQTGGNILAIVRNISERKQAEAAIRESEELVRFRANYDELTELPNRYNFMQQLDTALAMSVRRANMIGLLYLDLDRFKNVNDALGHHIGDLLLVEVSIRIKNLLRITDTVARLGGDEFTILLQDLDDDMRPLIIAEAIIDALSRPFLIEGHELYTSTSIGITLAPNDGNNASTLLKNADMAMYKAKEQGRNTLQYFTQELTDKAQHYVAMEKEIRRAIHQSEFILHYQPVIDLEHEQIVGVEALVRWNHPERGLVPPNEFIPIAEESNLIIDIGEWVFRTACKEVMRWSNQDLHLAINVSSNQLRGGFNRQMVEEILGESGFPAKRLNFEITESLLIAEESYVISTLRDFRELSIHLSIDDFGTGYSSLSYIRKFPVNILKIDRSFVRDMETDPGDAQLVETIIGMASNLNLRVIAEGVENQQQADSLREHGCDMVQGYHYGKPQPAESIQKLLSS
jgi:diguanylate cyclase (GGDEF)-like protein/PAS domain S-box-containing protein